MLGYEIFAPDKIVHGNTYGEWIARYWQWLMSIPKDHSPLYDTTGEHAGRSQSGPIFFLVNAPENMTVHRKCTIPESKKVMFPVNNSLFTNMERPTDASQQLRDLAEKQEEDVSEAGVTVDRQPLRLNPGFHLRDYRISSPVFTLQMKDNNIQGIKGEPNQLLSTAAVSDGYWFIIAFMPQVKPYNLRFRATGTYDDGSEFNIPFTTDVTYELTIKERGPCDDLMKDVSKLMPPAPAQQ